MLFAARTVTPKLNRDSGGGDYVTHTCAALKAARGEDAIIGVDGGRGRYGRRIIGYREDWVKVE